MAQLRPSQLVGNIGGMLPDRPPARRPAGRVRCLAPSLPRATGAGSRRRTAAFARASALAVLLAVLGASSVGADGRQLARVAGGLSSESAGGAAPRRIELTPFDAAAPSRWVELDDSGRFLFAAVAPGEYELAFAGVARRIEVIPGGTYEIALPLRRVAAAPVVAEELVVLAGEGRREPQSVVYGRSGTLLELLPAASRSAPSLSETLPTAVHDAASRFGGERAPALGGGLQHELVSLLDGVDTSFARSGGRLRLFLPSAAVQRVGSRFGGLGADYGRGAAGVIELSLRSGGEWPHGSALGVFQSPSWRAAPRGFELPRDDRVELRPEATLGGPLRPERAWFFVAAAETSTARHDQLDGALLDVGFQVRTALAKASLAPDRRGAHRLTLLALDAPVERTVVRPGSADRFTPCRCDEQQRLFSLHWGAQPTPRFGFEAQIAWRREETARSATPALLERPLDPAASPDDPDGNRSLYFDRGSGLRFNGLAVTGGSGDQRAPRDQAGWIGTWSTPGAASWQGGVDLQRASFASTSSLGDEYQGVGFSRSLPGGFAQPQFVRRYEPSVTGCCDSLAELSALHLERRWSAGRWAVRLGARLDRQRSENDLGGTVVETDDLAPRFGFTFDPGRDGGLLLRASLGRVVQTVPLELALRELSRLPGGANVFDELGWNRATGRYDRFRRRGVPAPAASIGDLDAYARDEAAASLDWLPAAGSRWRLQSHVVAWRSGDFYWSTDQFDAEGAVVRDVRNWEGGWRRGLLLVQQFDARLGRQGRLRLDGDLTWSRIRGNTFELDDDALYEGLGGVDPETGEGGVTVRFRTGHSPLERRWSGNLRAAWQQPVGRSWLRLGAQLGWRSGAPWGRTASVDLVHPVSDEVIRSSRFVEPRDARRLQDERWLHLSLAWSGPVLGGRQSSGGRRGRISGLRPEIGIEVANLTDEQVVLGINGNTGEPLPGVRALQAPREVRVWAGVRF